MKRLLFVALSVALLAVNPTAMADGWHGPGYGHGAPGAYKPGHHYPAYNYGPYYAHGYYPYHPYYPARPYYYPYRPYYYHPVGNPYPYYGGYYPYYQHHNNNNHSDWPAYLAGGLIVGALAMNAYNHSQTTTHTYTQTTPAAPVGSSVQGRHLLRDLSGKCYERQTDANGNEMRTELPASECNW